MGWKDLLQTGDEKITSPWVGGRSLRSDGRTWIINGRLPREFGWYSFSISARQAKLIGKADLDELVLGRLVRGYLVGDHIVQDDIRVDPDPKKILLFSEQVFLIEEGLDRFVRIVAGRTHEGGPLVYKSQEFPQGPEQEVMDALLDRKTSVLDIKGVTPALDAAFRMEVLHRLEAEKLRLEHERIRREAEERRQKEELRRELVEKLGDSTGRRKMAKYDFETAAKAALVAGDAEYLDHKAGVRKGEFVVRYRVDGRRFECVCDGDLRIVDAGICLTAHYDDPDFEAGTKGDTWFTLESIPSVIREAIREGKLVVFRHVDR